MTEQILFIISLLLTFAVFSFTSFRLFRFFKLTKKFHIGQWGKRILMMLGVAIGQTKIFRWPLLGFMHALVFWGFCFIVLGSIEMVIDGVFGLDKSLAFLGIFYDILMASVDIFAYLVLISILLFLIRRIFLHVKRFYGIEMQHKSHRDANFSLTMILLLMVSLIGMNYFYYAIEQPGEVVGYYPATELLYSFFAMPVSIEMFDYLKICWWSHILLIFIFANYLPYSKHFHVFMSVPNVFLSRLEPLGKLYNMENVTREVKIMMDPQQAFAAAPENAAAPERFGVKDAEDVTWKNYLDSLTCTECGRCTSVCPANTTGKKLSPRKIFIDLRARMKEKGPGMVKNGKEFSDNKFFIRDYISEEELWACTTCNACAQECPVNINHPSLIVDMRRYLVMEEGSAPGGLKSVFSNIENNGAPWQYSQQDRMLWTDDLNINVNGETKALKIPLLSELFAQNKTPEYLWWVGSAGAYDDRYKKVSKSFARILTQAGVNFAVLGTEEISTADAARRAGNEMLYQMQSLMIIDMLKNYGVKKILTCDPHAYNTFKNEYPDLDGNFEVVHSTQLLKELIDKGKLKA
ncbi:MAG: 4Fe-4S dicluster domain-containing protein, partial [Bacteroidota bacterium]